MKTFMPDSEPARNFSLPDSAADGEKLKVQREVVAVDVETSSSPKGAWCQAAMYGVGGSPAPKIRSKRLKSSR